MACLLDAVATGRWFDDPRHPGRRLRVSRHPGDGAVVVSLWRDEVCTGSFRLGVDAAAALAAELTAALVEAGQPPPRP